MPASAHTRSTVQPSSIAAHATTLRAAWPSKLNVSSTRPAPSSGAESMATRRVWGSFFQSKPFVLRASSTVRSSRRRSMSWRIRR